MSRRNCRYFCQHAEVAFSLLVQFCAVLINWFKISTRVFEANMDGSSMNWYGEGGDALPALMTICPVLGLVLPFLQKTGVIFA